MLLITIGGTSASAFSTSVSQTLLKSKCVGKTTPIYWRGGYPQTTNFSPTVHEPHGTVVLCYYKYQLASKGTDGDYYGIEVVSSWTHEPVDFDWDPAYLSQYATSDTASKDQVYDSTPTYTSNHSCATAVSVGLSLGMFSVSTPIVVCSGTKITATNPWSQGSTWTCGYANSVTKVDTGFVQKVKHGVVPTFKVGFTVPYYIYYTYPGGGLWKITSSYNYYNYTGI
jgi:hypothetical protein